MQDDTLRRKYIVVKSKQLSMKTNIQILLVGLFQIFDTPHSSKRICCNSMIPCYLFISFFFVQYLEMDLKNVFDNGKGNLTTVYREYDFIMFSDLCTITIPLLICVN